jgi:hypothetical protein
MRHLPTVAIAIALCGASGIAEARSVSRAREDTPRVQDARRMVRAMDDYDAQIAKRERQLRKEMRDMERMGKGR